MKKLLALTLLTVSFASGSAFAASFPGAVSDAMCGKNPAKVSSADHGKTITVSFMKK